MRSEIGAVYGPLVVAFTGISVAAATAGEEESGVLALTLAYPMTRSRLLLARAAAVAISVAVVVLGTFVGLVVGVAVGGGGISDGEHCRAGRTSRVLRVGCGRSCARVRRVTGRRALAIGSAAAFALLGFLLNGLAPLVDAIEWLKYLSIFYYYEGHDPIVNGVDAGDLAVLGAAALALTALAVGGFRDRDLRK